jgi:hypothetical protein
VLLARVGKRAPLRPGDAFLALDHQRGAHRAILRARWLKGFGKEGLTADDAQTVDKTIDSLKNELDEVTQKFEDATNQIATLTDERDEARALARQAIP